MTALPKGCTVCGTQWTETIDIANGRRCGEHPPGYSREHALQLVDQGDAAGAFATLRTWLARAVSGARW